jgi:hypothetical protein
LSFLTWTIWSFRAECKVTTETSEAEESAETGSATLAARAGVVAHAKIVAKARGAYFIESPSYSVCWIKQIILILKTLTVEANRADVPFYHTNECCGVIVPPYLAR